MNRRLIHRADFTFRDNDAPHERLMEVNIHDNGSIDLLAMDRDGGLYGEEVAVDIRLAPETVNRLRTVLIGMVLK